MADTIENQKEPSNLDSGLKKSSENGKKKGNIKLAWGRLAADGGNHPWNVWRILGMEACDCRLHGH